MTDANSHGMAGGQNFDLIVIGAGPGGYVAAIRAAQLGLKVACVEKDKLGGTCLNVGCIPSKALLESSELYAQARNKFAEHGIRAETLSVDLKKFMDRKDQIVRQLTGGVGGLFRKNKVTHVLGTARIHADKGITVTREGQETALAAKNILIATGSVPVPIPGIEIDNQVIVDSTGALSLTQIPKKMIVIGGGYIGLELGSVYLRLGGEVIVLEALDRIVPAMDREVGGALQKTLQKQGMAFQLSTKVKKATRKGETVEVMIEDAGGKESGLEADIVLVAAGRRPCTSGLGLEEAGIKTDEKGRVEVDKNFQTSLGGVYAVGDVIAGPMLAHKASEEGVAVAEHLAGQTGHVIDYEAIPSVVYTWPEVASVGLTEEQAKEKGIDYKAFKFPFLANGRALAMGEKDGFVKLIANKATDRILGAHVIGPRASDMIAELVVAIDRSLSATDIARASHAHPTLAEAVKEAALGLTSGAVHI